ncbi:MAG: pyruvate kinase [Elusimicrobia bacterium]|nr:pyruvate kinase [Elusimicrobiota bacterium]
MKKTKIVATLGPACDGPGILEQMIEGGVNVFRLNFSHGTPKDHARRIKAVRDVAQKSKLPVAILQDISGPKIRIGELSGRVAELRAGDLLKLTTKKIMGNRRQISVNYAGLPKDVKKSNSLFLADGLIEVEVLSTDRTIIQCRVLNGGRLTSHQGINFPDGTLHAEVITEKDKRDMAFGVEAGVDIVALSFVRDPKDIKQARALLAHLGKGRIPIIAKIEKHEALDRLDAIVQVSDGVMVARGDLGVEIPLQQVPLAQKKIITHARQMGKPSIVATHMLASMVARPRPTRAEVTDITTAVLDSADALMLSEETAVGKYPVESVLMMCSIIQVAEQSLNHRRLLDDTPVGNTVSDSISQAACIMAEDLRAKVIITPTAFGSTAQRVSRFRPRQNILALSHNPSILRFLNLNWGIVPIEIPRAHTLDDLFKISLHAAKVNGRAKKGDIAVVTAGVPLNKSGTTNLIKVERIES